MKKELVLSFAAFFCLFMNPLAAPADCASLEKVTGDRFIIDLRYNTENNFLKRNVYQTFALNECFLHRDMKEKLEDLVPLLKEKELKIVFWDCYRPISVQKKMWEIVPDARFVADPRKGSQHNRGIAVDITLADQSGLTMEMPTEFDDFSPKASPQYQCTETEKKKCQNRDLLIKIMGTVGLSPLNSEWWHYQLKSAGYPVIPELHE